MAEELEPRRDLPLRHNLALRLIEELGQLGHVLEQRIAGAVNTSTAGTRSAVAARCTVEEVIDAGLQQAKAHKAILEGGAGVPKLGPDELLDKLEEAVGAGEKRTATLGTMHKLMKAQEEHLRKAQSLLRSSEWDGKDHTEELRKLAFEDI